MDNGCLETVTVDESPPSSNAVTQHTFLPYERTVVADVHHDTVFNLFNLISEQVDGTAR